MTDVFISYSRRDGEFVRDLYGFLSEAGRDVWVDWEDIPPASQWEQDIYDSIDAADSLVFVVSASSLASEYCLAELGHAQGRGKRIVPLACDGAEPDAAPEGLRQLNWIWHRGADDRDEAFAKLASALDTDLEWSRAHTRLLVRAVEWEARNDSSLLLRGRDLKAVEQVLTANAGKEPVPTELQQRYVHASRRGAARRQRAVLGSVLVALAVSIGLGVLALLQRNDARTATRKATSVALSSTARLRVSSNPDQALLLALAAYRLSPSAEARASAFTALQAAQKLGVSEFLHGDSAIQDLAVAPNGRTLVTGSADGAVRLWDVAARKDLAELSPPGGSPVVSVAFARDGRLVAAGSANGKVRLWNVSTTQPSGRPLDAGRKILESAVSADGRRAAAIDGAGRVWLWDVPGGKLRRLTGPKGDLAMLAFSPDGTTLAAGASQTAEVEAGALGAVRLWDVPSGEPRDLPLDDETVYTLAFAPKGKRLATASYTSSLVSKYQVGDSSGTIRLWDLRKDALVAEAMSDQPTRSLAFAANGLTIAAGLDDGTIQLLRSDDLKRAAADVHGLAGTPAAIAFTQGGRALAAAAASDTSVYVWKLGADEGPGRVPFSSDLHWSVAVRPDRTVALAEGYDGVALLPARGGSAKPRWLRDPDSDASMQQVAFSGDGLTLAASSDDGSIHHWNLRSGEMKRIPPPKEPTSEQLSLDHEGTVLAAVGEFDGRLRLLPLSGGPAPKAPPLRYVTAAAFNSGGTLLTVTSDGSVRAWDVTRGTWDGPARRPVDSAAAAAVSADGRMIAFGDDAGKVWLWDRMGGAPAGDLPKGVSTLPTLSRDGRTFAVSTEQGVQLWDSSSRTPLGEPLSTKVWVRFAFTPDGLAVITADDTGVRRWDGLLWSDAAGLRSLVCSLVVGDLTKAEWAAIAPALPYRTTC